MKCTLYLSVMLFTHLLNTSQFHLIHIISIRLHMDTMVTSKHQDAMRTRGAGNVSITGLNCIVCLQKLIVLFVLINCQAPRVAFGSCQKRLMFPTHVAPDRMGNEMLARYSSKELGPGCYDNHTVSMQEGTV